MATASPADSALPTPWPPSVEKRPYGDALDSPRPPSCPFETSIPPRTVMVPLLVSVPVQRITVPLGTVSVTPELMVRFTNWKLLLVGGVVLQLVLALRVRLPALPSPNGEAPPPAAGLS